MKLTIPEKMLAAARELSRIAENIQGNPEIEGFHLSYAVGFDSDIRMADAQIGNVRSPYGGPSGIKFYSSEKTTRAATQHWLSPEFVTSWQTRSATLQQYGGAVVFPSTDPQCKFEVIGPSAFSGELDESIALLLNRVRQETPDDDYINKILSITGNTVYERVKKDFYGSS